MGRRSKLNMGQVDYFVLALAIGYISTLGLWGVKRIKNCVDQR